MSDCILPSISQVHQEGVPLAVGDSDSVYVLRLDILAVDGINPHRQFVDREGRSHCAISTNYVERNPRSFLVITLALGLALVDLDDGIGPLSRRTDIEYLGWDCGNFCRSSGGDDLGVDLFGKTAIYQLSSRFAKATSSISRESGG